MSYNRGKISGMQNSKSIWKNVSLVVLFLAAIIMGYLLMPKNPTVIPEAQVEENIPVVKLSPKWNERSNILSTEPDVFYERESGLTFSQAIDLTGDGITEGIFTGDGGNNNVSFIFIQNPYGVLVPAKQKEEDGTIFTVALYEVGRVSVIQNFKLLPAEHGFYTSSLVLDESANNTKTSHFKCVESSVISKPASFTIPFISSA